MSNLDIFCGHEVLYKHRVLLSHKRHQNFLHMQHLTQVKMHTPLAKIFFENPMSLLTISLQLQDVTHH